MHICLKVLHKKIEAASSAVIPFCRIEHRENDFNDLVTAFLFYSVCVSYYFLVDQSSAPDRVLMVSNRCFYNVGVPLAHAVACVVSSGGGVVP